MLQMKNPAQIYQIGVGGLVLLLLGAYFFFISPQLAAANEAKEAASTTLETTEMVKGRINVLSERVKDIDAAVTRVNDLTDSFPTTYKQDQFIAVLNAAAAGSNVKISTISTTQPADPDSFDESGNLSATTTEATQTAPKSGKKAPDGAIAAVGEGTVNAGAATAAPAGEIGDFPLAQIGVNMTIEGSNSAVSKFLRELSSLSRPVLLESVSIGGGEDRVTADLKGRTYLSRPLTMPDELKK